MQHAFTRLKKGQQHLRTATSYVRDQAHTALVAGAFSLGGRLLRSGVERNALKRWDRSKLFLEQPPFPVAKTRGNLVVLIALSALLAVLATAVISTIVLYWRPFSLFPAPPVPVVVVKKGADKKKSPQKFKSAAASWPPPGVVRRTSWSSSAKNHPIAFSEAEHSLTAKDILLFAALLLLALFAFYRIVVTSGAWL